MTDEDRPTGSGNFELMVGISRLNTHKVEETRRQAQRRKWLQATTDNDILAQKNRRLEEEVKRLEAERDMAVGFARTHFFDGKALRKTIRHLEDAWVAETPTSPALAAISAGLDGFYHSSFAEVQRNSEVQLAFEDAWAKHRQKHSPAKAGASPKSPDPDDEAIWD